VNSLSQPQLFLRVVRPALSNKEEDIYVFKVPTLRKVATPPPYFHDGSVATLPEAAAVPQQQ
jgi:cytochrome c peroxidase